MEAISMELMETIKDTIIKNHNKPNTYVIDMIQVLILRKTNQFLMYNECEEIFNIIGGN